MMNILTNFIRPLNLDEKKFLLAVERGDTANVRRYNFYNEFHELKKKNIGFIKP